MFGEEARLGCGMRKMFAGPLGALSASFLFALVLGGTVPALAKDASIKVPEVIQIKSGIESLLPIEIGPMDLVPPKAMVLIRGIPATTSLTDGRLFPSGIWVVKPSSVGELRLITGSNTVEDANVTISLVTLEGDHISTASARLMVAPNAEVVQSPQNAVPAVAITRDKNEINPAAPSLDGGAKPSLKAPDKPALNAPAPARAAVRPLWSPTDLEKILKLMERGDRYLGDGKIDFARRFYQLVAEMGSPEGAEAVARTYDPEYLRRFPIVGGLNPDQAKAKEWYAKADEIRANFEKSFQAGRN